MVPINKVNVLEGLMNGVQLEFYNNFNSYLEDKNENNLDYCKLWAEKTKRFFLRQLDCNNQISFFEKFVTQSFDFIDIIELLEVQSHLDSSLTVSLLELLKLYVNFISSTDDPTYLQPILSFNWSKILTSCLFQD